MKDLISHMEIFKLFIEAKWKTSTSLNTQNDTVRDTARTSDE